MEKATRTAIERATQKARALLEEDYRAQLEGTYDVLLSGEIPAKAGGHLTPRQALQRASIVAAIEHRRANGMEPAAAVADYVRDAAFTTLNRFVALKMLEARDLVQECVTRGEQSRGFIEFCGLAPGLALLPDSAGYRLYVECLFDELSTEIKVLFDRRDPASILWPRRQAFEALLAALNVEELTEVWGQDETIGWVYQYFNSGEERRSMREESQAPRNSRELAVRNQFFTPRYVVQFLVDNTLGRTWVEMMDGKTRLAELDYLVQLPDARPPRAKKDPRDLRILDPASGSGHFLLYAFDLLETMYREAWADPCAAAFTKSDAPLRQEFADEGELIRNIPEFILRHNLHGIDIDPRCAQIAALALWMRGQRAYNNASIARADRPRIRRINVVVAEPMPGDKALVATFAASLQPPLLADLFREMVGQMELAGDLGSLLPIERTMADTIKTSRERFTADNAAPLAPLLPGMSAPPVQTELDLSGIDDDRFFEEAEGRLLAALHTFTVSASGARGMRRRLFAEDSAQGIALVEMLRARFDVVLMNPPFGAASLGAKQAFEHSYPRTKQDIYAAFVQRGIDLLPAHGLLGAITARTGFFLSSFEPWRRDVLVAEAPPLVFADLGHGVMDAALVEAAAYCLEKFCAVQP